MTGTSAAEIDHDEFGLSGGNDFCRIHVCDRSIGHVARNVPSYLADLERVTETRPSETIAWMNQVHGTSIRQIGPDHEHQTSVKEIDGIWTNHPGVVLVAKTADCAPLLLWSREAGIVAALHCGWAGYFAGILEQFETLCTGLGHDFRSFGAYLGPMLREPNFEVREDFVSKIPTAKKPFLKSRGKQLTYDLATGITHTLGALGITAIEDCGVDTFTSPDHYSYRAWSKTPKHQRPKHYPTFATSIVMREKP
jgi:YfiH family protein